MIVANGLCSWNRHGQDALGGPPQTCVGGGHVLAEIAGPASPAAGGVSVTRPSHAEAQEAVEPGEGRHTYGEMMGCQRAAYPMIVRPAGFERESRDRSIQSQS
ncbi:hypothetical protein GCM10010361_70170 [Streptomyces olivaceiscleroticus]|uniref:Uncharacterized protein n=1 Tax=Streptomyces olivaceiscleroticus TaxID=68245 RepID=A0ABP3L7G6_9ACTN